MMFEALEKMLVVPTDNIRAVEDSFIDVVGKLNDVIGKYGLFCLFVKKNSGMEYDYSLNVFSTSAPKASLVTVCRFYYDYRWNLMMRYDDMVSMMNIRKDDMSDRCVDNVSTFVERIFTLDSVTSYLRRISGLFTGTGYLGDSKIRELIRGKEISWDRMEMGEFGNSEGIIELNGFFFIEERGGMLRMKREIRDVLVLPN